MNISLTRVAERLEPRNGYIVARDAGKFRAIQASACLNVSTRMCTQRV